MGHVEVIELSSLPTWDLEEPPYHENQPTNAEKVLDELSIALGKTKFT